MGKSSKKEPMSNTNDNKAIKLQDVVNSHSRGYGGAELKKYLSGGRLSPSQAIRAYCYDCMGYYIDNAEDCENDLCPLHPFMPYNKNKQKMNRNRALTSNDKEKMQKARRGKHEKEM